MKKRIILVFITFILIVFFAIILLNIHTSDLLNADTLKKAFASSGANIVNSECYVWCTLDKGFCRKNGIERTAEIIADRLGIVKDGNYLKTDDESDNMRKVFIYGFLPDGREVSAGVQLDRKSLLDQNYTGTVSLTENGNGSLLKASGEKALQALEGLADKISLNFSIKGNFDSKLKEEALDKILSRVFNAIEAKKVYEMEDRETISISAYSPLLVNHVELEGKRTNLNLAIRYNSYEGKTYIWLATPVITTEY